MKKKLVITVVVFLLGIPPYLFSQVNTYVVGVDGGLGISSLRTSLSDEIRVGFTLGLTGQYNYSDLLGVKTGIGYELKGSSDIIPLEENPVKEGKYYENFHFLTIPILANVTFENKLKFLGNKIKYFANAGPYFGFLLKQTSKIPATEYSEKVKVNNTENFKRIEFGLALGGGFNYSATKKIGLSVEIRDNFGLNNLYKANQTNDGKLKTNAAYILFGIAYSL